MKEILMHSWGDENVDWNGINYSARYIGENLKKWGRVSVLQYKEKFGTVRVYCSLGWRNLLNITHPGYIHYRPYPKWLMTFDIYVLSRIIPYLNFIILPYHKWLYRKLHKDMVKKYPHLKEEILCMADYDELLKGI
jgi:hypothetical protein